MLAELNGYKNDNTKLSDKIEYLNSKLDERQRNIDSMLLQIEKASMKTDEERRYVYTLQLIIMLIMLIMLIIRLRAEYEKTLRKISLGSMLDNNTTIKNSNTTNTTNTTSTFNNIDVQTDDNVINIDTCIVKNPMESFYLNISSDNYNDDDDDDINDSNLHNNDSHRNRKDDVLEKIEKSKKLIAKKSNKSYYSNKNMSSSNRHTNDNSNRHTDDNSNRHTDDNSDSNKDDWAMKGVKRIELMLEKKGWKMNKNQ